MRQFQEKMKTFPLDTLVQVIKKLFGAGENFILEYQKNKYIWRFRKIEHKRPDKYGNQVVGKIAISKVSQNYAEYLKLPNAN